MDMEQSRYVDRDARDLPRAAASAMGAPASCCSRISIAARRSACDASALRRTSASSRAPIWSRHRRLRAEARRRRELSQTRRDRAQRTMVTPPSRRTIRRSSSASRTSSRRGAACPNAAASSFKCSTASPTPLARFARRSAAIACASRYPYGDFWFPYLMRRLAERPANVGFFLQGAP